MSFRIKKHTADVRMEVKGNSPKELFTDALKGMNEIIYPGFCTPSVRREGAQRISLSTVDITALLIDFLSEVLTLTHVNKILFCYVDFQELKEKSLNAIIYGMKVDHFEEDIKAVTYTEAEVIKNKEGEYQTMVVFDI